MKRKTNKHKAKMQAAIYQTARDLHEAGLMDQAIMRRFGASCLTPVAEVTAPEIRAIRKREWFC